MIHITILYNNMVKKWDMADIVVKIFCVRIMQLVSDILIYHWLMIGDQ